MQALLGEPGGLSREELGGILGRPSQQERYEIARTVYQRHRDRMDPLMTALGRELETVFLAHRREYTKFLAGDGDAGVKQWLGELDAEYKSFDFHDMLALTFLEGSQTKEHTQVEIYRVSPADSSLRLKGKRGDEKLAGTALGGFGAFLERRWRENDMMWGRLDGAEQIVRALLPHPDDEALRDHYVGKVREAILEEELSPENTDRIFQWLAEQLHDRVTPRTSAAELARETRGMLESFPGLASMIDQKRFETFVGTHYAKPAGPPPDVSLGWVARASRILGRMIDDISADSKRKPNSLARLLQTTGVLLTHGVRFATPNTIWEKLRYHWLWLIALAGIVLVIAAPVLSVPGAAHAGYAVVAAALVAGLILRALARFLTGDRVGLLKHMIVAAVVAVFVIAPWAGDHPYLAREIWDMLVSLWTAAKG